MKRLIWSLKALAAIGAFLGLILAGTWAAFEFAGPVGPLVIMAIASFLILLVVAPDK